MEFFRKVKNFVTGQVGGHRVVHVLSVTADKGHFKHLGLLQSEPGTSTSSGASASTTVPQTRAAVTYRQPVLQNAGFGTAGGVQVI